MRKKNVELKERVIETVLLISISIESIAVSLSLFGRRKQTRIYFFLFMRRHEIIIYAVNLTLCWVYKYFPQTLLSLFNATQTYNKVKETPNRKIKPRTAAKNNQNDSSAKIQPVCVVIAP